MVFIDILAFEEVTLLMAAVLLGYVGVLGLFSMRRNDPAGVKGVLKGAAIPLGAVGVIATTFGIWGEMVWQYPAPYLASYNILFNDTYLLFGLTLLGLAISMALTLKLQYVGLFALVAGGTTIAYGYQGWVLGMTKDPLETFLLFGAFGLAGILAFPVTLVTDHYLAHSVSVPSTAPESVATPSHRPSIQTASRAVQPIVPVTSSGTPDETESYTPKFRLPIYISVTMLIFVVAVALAAIAALYYLDATLPAHLASAP